VELSEGASEQVSKWASGQVVSDLQTCRPVNLIITGFMGTGKSEVGREVARRLGWGFVDMDTLIEERVGMTIPEIFAQRGERFFRQQERQLCQELTKRRGLVIATGGGAVIPEGNRQALGRSGLLVCLTCDVGEILQRLAQAEDRPLLEVADRRERIETLLAQRREAYDRIPHQIDTTGLTVEEVAERVIGLLGDGKGIVVEKIEVQTPTGCYQIHLGKGLLARVGELARQQGLRGRVALVTNPTVGDLYASMVIKSLREAGFEPVICQLPDGEAYKTLDTVSSLYDQFIEGELDRYGTVLALGGGVIGDLAGFAAATYMRGVPLVQLPTTLLAMVDASIGGKVAVDHPRGKNLIGAFKQPELVVIDPLVLATLDEAEMRSGWAEVIKAGVSGSPSLFEQLEERGDKLLLPAIAEAIRVKVAIVEEDPYEHDQRAVLNLGHTFGHALEVLSSFTLRHGEAVSIGMVAAARTAVALGLCDEAVEGRLAALLRRFGLPTRYEGYEPGEVWEAMATDKKRRGKKLRFVLPGAIGQVVATDEVPKAMVLKVLERLRKR
jgi:shikimate kinase/3-dehydroquinate synthase